MDTADANDLRAQNIRLRDVLSVKKDQIANYRNMLQLAKENADKEINSLRKEMNSNKKEADQALVSLREKHKSEKSEYVEIIAKLRKQLEIDELAAQNNTLRELLSVKNEQITALHMERETTENCLVSLKSQHVEDSEEINSLRTELQSNNEKAENDLIAVQELYEKEKDQLMTEHSIKKDLTEQNNKLRVLLGVKSKHILSLLTELNANLETAEKTYDSLRLKFETEKAIDADKNEKLICLSEELTSENSNLKMELKECNEERATLAARCEALEAKNALISLRYECELEKRAQSEINEQLRKELVECKEATAAENAMLTSKCEELQAQNSLISLRCEYEAEKRANEQIKEELKKEAKKYKEEAATFAADCAILTAKCEDLEAKERPSVAADDTLTAKCEELQKKVTAFEGELKEKEEETKKLNNLLRMAIRQKLAVTARLEGWKVELPQQKSNEEEGIRVRVAPNSWMGKW